MRIEKRQFQDARWVFVTDDGEEVSTPIQEISSAKDQKDSSEVFLAPGIRAVTVNGVKHDLFSTTVIYRWGSWFMTIEFRDGLGHSVTTRASHTGGVDCDLIIVEGLDAVTVLGDPVTIGQVPADASQESVNR